LDERSHLALEAYSLIAHSPSAESPVSVEFVFGLMGIEPTSMLAREVYERIGLIVELQSKKQERARTQGKSSEDILAGSSHGEDDDEDC